MHNRPARQGRYPEDDGEGTSDAGRMSGVL